jgi:hypothetical protein
MQLIDRQNPKQISGMLVVPTHHFLIVQGMIRRNHSIKIMLMKVYPFSYNTKEPEISDIKKVTFKCRNGPSSPHASQNQFFKSPSVPPSISFPQHPNSSHEEWDLSLGEIADKDLQRTADEYKHIAESIIHIH